MKPWHFPGKTFWLVLGLGLFWLAVPLAVLATAYHTITIEGTNSGWTTDETFIASSADNAYFTWDSTHLYFGIADAEADYGNMATFMYFDTDPQPDPNSGNGTLNGYAWTENITLTFRADYVVVWKNQTGSDYIEVRQWDGSSWNQITATTTANLGADLVNFSVTTGNDYREVRIKRSLLGNPTAIYAAAFTEQQWGSNWRYFHWPANAGTDENRASGHTLSHWYGFVLSDSRAPNHTANTDCAPTQVVTSTQNSGAGTLRQTIATLCDGGAIGFNVTDTITLSSEILLTRSLTLNGPGASALALSGGGSTRLFTVNSGATVTINDLTLTNGYRSGANGGALLNHGALTLNRCNATNNFVAVGAVSGGVIYNDGTFTANDCTFSGNGNVAYTTYGGVLFNTGNATFNNSTFQGNGAVLGSVMDNESLGQLNLTNCTLSGNQGSGSGAAGAALENLGTLNLNHVTLANNTGSRGSALDNWGTINVWNSIFSNNSSGCFNNPYGPVINDYGGNLTWNSASCPGTASDPKLDVLNDNGGRTLTHALLPGSAAIDLLSSCTVATDQRGVPRPQHGQCDSGAFEANRVFVDRDATGLGTGLSWTDAYTRLSTALISATYGSEFWVAEGVYTPTNVASPNATFLITPGIQLYGGFAATETLLTQRNLAAHVTILSGDLDGNDTNSDGNFSAETWNALQGTNAYHVLTLEGIAGLPITGTTVIDGFTITAGNANGNSAPNERGGGLYCKGSGAGHACSPALTNLTFSGNQAYTTVFINAYGGGLYADGSSGGGSSPAFTNVIFTGNRAYASQMDVFGGALYSQGAGGTSSPLLNTVIFTGNQAYSTMGSNYGGALYNNGSSGVSSPVLTNVTFINNQTNSDMGYGGGMSNNGNSGGVSAPRLTQVSFIGNQAAHGGALYNEGIGGTNAPLLVNVTFRGNQAPGGSGGGMSNEYSSPTLINVLFSGNQAGSGGGMFNSNAVSPSTLPRLFNVTFSGNTAYFGGALYNGSGSGTCAVTLVNSILWGNTANNAGPQIFNESSSSTANLAYTTLEGSCPSYTTCGAGMVYTNPRFVAPIAASNAPTTAGDYHLQFGSPAIDAGNILSVTAGTDLDGKARIVNSVVDLGAYESDYVLLTVERGGAGGGSITSLPAGIDCGISCTYGFQLNSIVTLTATPFITSTFAGWSGAVVTTTNPITIFMDAAKQITAAFTLNDYALTISQTGTGSGVVTPTIGVYTYTYGTVVTLTAAPNLGSTFTGWSGAVTSTANPLAFALTTTSTVTATFTLNTYTLTVATTGNGSGVVTPSVGLHPYLYGDSVTLLATADFGSTFTGWSGDVGCADGAVTMDSNKICTATFTLNPPTGLNASNDSPTILTHLTSLTATLTGGINVTYTWDLGDGTRAVGALVTHRYAAAGSYTAIVTATNNSGSLSAATQVTITSAAPVAAAGPDQSVLVGTPVQLDGSGSTDPDGHLPLGYSWQQTSGPAVLLSSATVSRPTFTAPGAASVLQFSLTVTDATGLASAPDTVTLTVTLHKIYLPLVLRSYVMAPDLVVTRIVATSANLQVVIRNQGTQAVPVNTANEFWVDVYLNPTTAPTSVNQTWQRVDTQGLVWGVTLGALPAFTPGGMLTLMHNGPYYQPA